MRYSSNGEKLKHYLRNMKRLLFLFICGIIMPTLFTSCSSDGPQAIRYGEEQCVYCKMTISDPRFGTQIITDKGRAFNFDDAQCMIAFIKAGDVDQAAIKEIYLPDYTNDHELFPAKDMLLLKSESLKSPMRGDIAAFKNETDLEEARKIHGGEVLTWDDLLN